MKGKLWLTAFALWLAVSVSAADNPFKTAKVGDWVEYATTTGGMGHDMQMTTKQTVVAKDDTSVTLRNEATAMGQKMPPHDVKIPFDKPYEPYKSSSAATDATTTLIGEGNETITVGGKPYACHWVKMKVVATKPAPTNGTVKVWSCSDVPAGGMVKMEMENEMKVEKQTMTTTMVMELKGFGRK